LYFLGRDVFEDAVVIAILRGAAVLFASVSLFGISLAGGGSKYLIPAYTMVFLALLPVVPHWRVVAWLAVVAASAAVIAVFVPRIGDWHMPSLAFGACEIAISVALAWNHFRVRDEPSRVTWN
jgi:hypothetical protein